MSVKMKLKKPTAQDPSSKTKRPGGHPGAEHSTAVKAFALALMGSRGPLQTGRTARTAKPGKDKGGKKRGKLHGKGAGKPKGHHGAGGKASGMGLGSEY